MKYIVLLGSPGSGKGTQAKKVAKEFNLVHVSSGDVFRSEIERKTELGQTAERYLTSGQLVPDDVTVNMVVSFIKRSGGDKDGYLMDGFPRTLGQARFFDEYVSRSAGNLTGVIFLDISDAEALRRISSRRQCEGCGRIYGAGSAEKCECGGRLVTRKDDMPEVVSRRLEVYRENTATLIEYYRGQGLLKCVSGEQSVDDVYRSIIENLGINCGRAN